jgi:hypothetical protein
LEARVSVCCTADIKPSKVLLKSSPWFKPDDLPELGVAFGDWLLALSLGKPTSVRSPRACKSVGDVIRRCTPIGAELPKRSLSFSVFITRKRGITGD